MPPKKDEAVEEEESFEPTFSHKPETRIYWSRAAGLSIAGFHKEIREGNAIIQPEASLRFTDHTKVTEDPEMIEFIESSNSFRDGKVIRVNSLEEANKMTASVRAIRQIREVTSTSDVVSPTVGRK